MKLFKLSFRNIRRSVRDYGIYFFTLVLGIAIFYVFNAIETQTAMIRVQHNTQELLNFLNELIGGLSVFVAIVMGLLVVYASRFLIRRRHREFAIYMTLGMGKGSIAGLLTLETALIGLFSLVVGLLLGIGLSQLMSALVVQLFEVDMTAYAFTFSLSAFWKTILYFAIILAVSALFDLVMIGRSRLITLMQSEVRSEKSHMKHPALCIILFVIGTGTLGVDYYLVTQKLFWLMEGSSGGKIFLVLAAGTVSTFLIFWSASGLLLLLLQRAKKTYYKGINCFTFRQITSRINTMVVSISVICLMLFVTIVVLSAALSLRTSLNQSLQELAPVDLQISKSMATPDVREVWEQEFEGIVQEGVFDLSAVECLGQVDLDLYSMLSDYVEGAYYQTHTLTFADALGELEAQVKQDYPMLDFEGDELIMKISDYNAVAALIGQEQCSLAEDEYLMLCDFDSAIPLREAALRMGTELDVFGHKLHPKQETVVRGYTMMSSAHTNDGILLVPDDAVDEAYCRRTFLMGNFMADTKEETQEIEQEVREAAETFAYESGWALSIESRLEISNTVVGIGAVVTFLSLYLGLVFLIAGAAILALKALTDCMDSLGRYETLRRIGASEKSIAQSLFLQEAVLFLMPLTLAIIHSAFGIQTVQRALETVGYGALFTSILFAALVILLIYGGYFLVTYFISRSILRKS